MRRCVLEAGPGSVLPSVGGRVMRERSELGAGSASVSGDRTSAELEDGSNGPDSVLDLLLDAMGKNRSVACDRSCAGAYGASLVCALPVPVPPELICVKATNFLRQRATASDSPRSDLQHDTSLGENAPCFPFGEHGPDASTIAD